MAGLDDISSAVYVQLSSPLYDGATKTLRMGARLVNHSPDTLRAPLAVRLLTIASDVGLVRLEGATGPGKGEGAVIDFTSLLPPGGLAPSSSSAERTLRFTLSDLLPDQGIRQFGYRTLVLEGLVLGHRR